MSETCTECGEPATAHAPTCWLGPSGRAASDEAYTFTLVAYAALSAPHCAVIDPGEPPCDGQLTGIASRCGGRGWLAVEDGEIYCSCAAGERLRKSE